MQKIPNCYKIKSAAKDTIPKNEIKSWFMPVLLAILLSFGFTIPKKSCELTELNEKHGNKEVVTTDKQTLLKMKEAYFHPLFFILPFFIQFSVSQSYNLPYFLPHSFLFFSLTVGS